MGDNINNYGFNEQEEQITIDLSTFIVDLWRGFKNYWWLVLTLAIVTAGLNCVREYRGYHPYYSSFASFTVSLNTASDGSMYEDNLRASQLSITFPYIIYSGVLKNIIADDLGLEYVSESITAENVENTNLFTIRVTSDDPQMAYDVLQSVIRNYPSIAETVVGGTNLTMLDESGVDKVPVNRINYKNSLKLGVIPGAGLGLIVILIYAITRKTIHKPEDIGRLSNIKQLGTLPQVVFKKRGKKNCNIISINHDNLQSSYVEGFYKIRAKIDKILSGKEIKSILITSAIPGEGKSTFAFNLAISLAKEGKRVVLVDCDFRRPTVKSLLAIEKDIPGIEEVLSGDASLSEAIRYYEEYEIHSLVCTKPINRSSEVIDTPQMHNLVKELEEFADYVILDSAPSAILSDTSDLAKLVDGVIYIIKQDYSKVYHILDGLDHLSESSDAIILGCVLNGVKSDILGYGYGYGYGHYGRYGYGYGKKKDKSELALNDE
ncbi:MAG: capsular exopolysaccharide family [Herbinix sp.]|jgi:receptor protein-tyrosine kinase|nr:capsular exopolysaccharide family [Herbinix sp.]